MKKNLIKKLVAVFLSYICLGIISLFCACGNDEFVNEEGSKEIELTEYNFQIYVTITVEDEGVPDYSSISLKYYKAINQIVTLKSKKDNYKFQSCDVTIEVTSNYTYRTTNDTLKKTHTIYYYGGTKTSTMSGNVNATTLNGGSYKVTFVTGKLIIE